MTRKEIVSSMRGSRNAETGVGSRNARVRTAAFKLTGRQIVVVVLTVLVFMTCSIGYVWSNFERTQLGYSISQLKSEQMRLLNVNTQLRVEMAFLKSAERLEQVASEELGMKFPTPNQIVVLP